MAIGIISVYLLLAVAALCYYLHTRIFSYWQRKGIPNDEPHWFYGNLQGLRTEKHFIHVYRGLYNKHKATAKFVGFYFFFKPAIFLLDLDLVQRILVKDFNNFADRGMFTNEKSDPLSAHLFNLDGQKWRNLRNKLSSTFTSGKMKKMFPIVVEIAEKFSEVYAKQLEEDFIVEIKEFNARFTTDVIGTCAFGIECNSLKDPKAKFREMGARSFTDKRHSVFVEGLILSFPKWAERLTMKMTPQHVEDFFLKVVDDTIAFREKNNIVRNDFMSMLIDMKNQVVTDENGKQGPGLTRGQLAAQAFVFFLAGFETSSTTMGFCMYELALHPEIQETLRQEILRVLEETDGELTYDSLAKMDYLDKVIMETLRKYPVLHELDRIAMNDYKIPGTNHVIEKGTRFTIPVDAIHYDPEIYPEPEKFDPERYNPEEIKKRHPMTWLPFGEGPRNCIGLRFGKMQVKVGLIYLLKSYSFSICDKTVVPIQIDLTQFLVSSLGGIFLKVQKI